MQLRTFAKAFRASIGYPYHPSTKGQNFRPTMLALNHRRVGASRFVVWTALACSAHHREGSRVPHGHTGGLAGPKYELFMGFRTMHKRTKFSRFAHSASEWTRIGAWAPHIHLPAPGGTYEPPRQVTCRSMSDITALSLLHPTRAREMRAPPPEPKHTRRSRHPHPNGQRSMIDECGVCSPTSRVCPVQLTQN